MMESDQERLEEMLAEVDDARQTGAVVGAFYRGALEQVTDAEATLSLTWRYMSSVLGEDDDGA